IQRREVPNQPFDHIKHQLEGKVTLLARLRDAIDVGARITPQHLKLLTSEVEEISRYETSLVAPSGRYSGSLPHYEAERMTRLERELARKYASTLTLLTAMINASLTR
ncbi:MAG: hypothetical protein KDD64_04060, partial [Bdellovibrionales bacterium]|nr:hypothetical protein [Bdellovibrionales bacterium]